MTGKKKIRYAVVGLGYIAKKAILPAFRNATANSQLAALVSNNPDKLKKLSHQYKVDLAYSYDDYEDCLRSGEIDAVYIALPNDMHREFTIRAAKAGIHVLCEKPMAVTEKECIEMILENEIVVDVKDGNVTLRGTISNKAQENKVLDLVGNVKGVKEVRSLLIPGQE